ncbi:MAG: glycosyltransferase [Candidatus Thermoplasmatota archaeon]|nr:glycosyltransferase [Candidatus Thermoplasmatota archaeon]
MDTEKKEVRNPMNIEPSPISLVVPCYLRNREDADKLDRLLSSAILQTLPFDNVIIVDDGSEFRSECQLENVVLIRLRENSGPARARNVGMEEALKRGGEIIFFTDHDCILDPEWSSKMVESMKRNSVQAAGGVTLAYGKTLIDEFHDLNRTHHGILGSAGEKYVDYQPTCNFAITDRVAREYKFDENFTVAAGEDVDYCLRVRKRYRIGYCEDAVVRHDYGYRNSISGSKSFIKMFKRYRESLFILFTLHSDYFGEPYAPPPPFKSMIYDLVRYVIPIPNHADRNSGILIFYVVKSMMSGYIKNVLHFMGKVDRISRIPPFLLLKTIEYSISYWHEPKVGLFKNYKHQLTFQITPKKENSGQKYRTCVGPEKERIPVELVLKGIRDMARYLSKVTVSGEEPFIYCDDVLRVACLTAELGIPMTVAANGCPPRGKFLSEMKRLQGNLVISTDTPDGRWSIGTDNGNASGQTFNDPGTAVNAREECSSHNVRGFAWLNIIILPDGDVVKYFEHRNPKILGNLREDDLIPILSSRRANRTMRELKR